MSALGVHGEDNEYESKSDLALFSASYYITKRQLALYLPYASVSQKVKVNSENK